MCGKSVLVHANNISTDNHVHSRSLVSVIFIDLEKATKPHKLRPNFKSLVSVPQWYCVIVT